MLTVDIVKPFEIGCGKYYVDNATKRKLFTSENVTFIKPLVAEKKTIQLLLKPKPKPLLMQEEKEEKENKSGWVKTRKSKWIQDKNESDIRTFFSREKIPLLPLSALSAFDLDSCTRYFSFERQDPSGDLQLINKRQRSPWWFKERLCTLTGSKLVNAMGLFDFDSFLKTWYETYDGTNLILDDMTKSQCGDEITKGEECMAWGTFHEIDALATLVHHLAVENDLEFYETTLTRISLPKYLVDLIKVTLKKEFNHDWKDEIDDEIWSNAFKSSPDCSGKECRTGNVFVAELKCAYGLRFPKTYAEIPYYYYPQVQFHMLTNPKAEYAYFLSWSPTRSKIWRVERDTQFWKIAIPALCYFHKMGLDKVPPSSLMDSRIGKDVKEYCKEQSENCIYIGEFDSIFAKREPTVPSPSLI
jgi:hypothetical protein